MTDFSDDQANRRAVVDWAEGMGLETLRNHLGAMTELKKEAAQTLTVFLAGASALVGYVISALDKPSDAAVVLASAVLGIYVFVLCGLIVSKCMVVADAPTVGNHPLRLAQVKYSITAIKEAELKNIEERIAQAKERNEGTARWLNRVRGLALLSPLVFSFAWMAFHCGAKHLP
jgi:hypothetical protein